MTLLELAVAGQIVFQTAVAPSDRQDFASPANPVFLGYPHGPNSSEFVPAGRKLISHVAQFKGAVSGKVLAPGDAWTVDSRASNLVSGFGSAISEADDAVYSRDGDWLLVFAADSVEFQEVPGGYRVKAVGEKVEVRLYEHYYRDHLGYFLWDTKKPLWTRPVMGWCSWMAHLQDVNEKKMLDAAEFFGKHLKAYGYDVVQMDDGYQRIPQMGPSGFSTQERVADLWLKANDKFPSGLAELAKRIRLQGMTPGIWVGLYLPLSPSVPRYVLGADGKPLRGPWVNYAVDGMDDAALEAGYLSTFRGLKKDGWGYIKVDTLRHVLYDSYRKTPDYFKSKGEMMEVAYRRILSRIKDVWGRDVYLLACWGTLPELAGIPDGCRIGEDVGPDIASMRRTAKYVAQFHYLNNVVWRNDPDYMCFRVGIEPSRTWASLLSLTGCQTMVSDPLDAYDEARMDILRRVGPSALLRPKVVGSLPPNPELAVMQSRKDGENWTVAGRFALDGDRPKRSVAARELGLDPHRKYLAYDFWRDRLLGEVEGSVSMDALQEGGCQVISLRPATGHPQVLGTDRHVLQGVIELDRVRWSGSKLSGTMLLGPERAWSLHIYVPEGYAPELGSGMTLVGRVLTVRFPVAEGRAKWSVAFKQLGKR